MGLVSNDNKSGFALLKVNGAIKLYQFFLIIRPGFQPVCSLTLIDTGSNPLSAQTSLTFINTDVVLAYQPGNKIYRYTVGETSHDDLTLSGSGYLGSTDAPKAHAVFYQAPFVFFLVPDSNTYKIYQFTYTTADPFLIEKESLTMSNSSNAPSTSCINLNVQFSSQGAFFIFTSETGLYTIKQKPIPGWQNYTYILSNPLVSYSAAPIIKDLFPSNSNATSSVFIDNPRYPSYKAYYLYQNQYKAVDPNFSTTTTVSNPAYYFELMTPSKNKQIFVKKANGSNNSSSFLTIGTTSKTFSNIGNIDSSDSILKIQASETHVYFLFDDQLHALPVNFSSFNLISSSLSNEIIDFAVVHDHQIYVSKKNNSQFSILKGSFNGSGFSSFSAISLHDFSHSIPPNLTIDENGVLWVTQKSSSTFLKCNYYIDSSNKGSFDFKFSLDSNQSFDPLTLSYGEDKLFFTDGAFVYELAYDFIKPVNQAQLSLRSHSHGIVVNNVYGEFFSEKIAFPESSPVFMSNRDKVEYYLYQSTIDLNDDTANGARIFPISTIKASPISITGLAYDHYYFGIETVDDWGERSINGNDFDDQHTLPPCVSTLVVNYISPNVILTWQYKDRAQFDFKIVTDNKTDDTVRLGAAFSRPTFVIGNNTHIIDEDNGINTYRLSQAYPSELVDSTVFGIYARDNNLNLNSDHYMHIQGEYVPGLPEIPLPIPIPFTELEEEDNKPKRIYNYPNPFYLSTGTTIVYTLDESADADLIIFDMSGYQLTRVSFLSGQNGAKAGENRVLVDQQILPSRLSSGIYFYQIMSNQTVLNYGSMVLYP